MNGRRPHVCVVGSTNLDLTFHTPRLPRPGETVAGLSLQTGHGGKGANQAVMAARLGARVTMIGRVGRDAFGDAALANFHDEGIDTTFVGRDPTLPTGTAAILVDDKARNCIVVVPGANHALRPEDVQAAAPVLASADTLLGQLEVPLDVIEAAFRLAKAANVRTILNPAPARPLPDELLRLCDLCVPNESEMEALTGLPAATLEQAEAAARELLRRGPPTVIVTLGERGALVVDAQQAKLVPASPVYAVDPTGAGDAFIGSLAVFLAEGLPLPDAVRQANATAALSVTRLGTQTSFPRRDEMPSRG